MQYHLYFSYRIVGGFSNPAKRTDRHRKRKGTTLVCTHYSRVEVDSARHLDDVVLVILLEERVRVKVLTLVGGGGPLHIGIHASKPCDSEPKIEKKGEMVGRLSATLRHTHTLYLFYLPKS